MAPHDLRRPFKRPAISDQQKRRDLSLLRQAQSRRDAQDRARCLASTILSFQSDPKSPPSQYPEIQPHELELEPSEPQLEREDPSTIYDVRQASKLRGAEARRWFAKQLMLPEWMIDVPPNLSTDWYVFARPAGKRCFVVSSNGTAVSRLRNGTFLRRFPSALPSGARKNNRSARSYSILTAYFTRHAHYQAGNTPLALVWKDENCSQYVIDTDSKGQGPNQQQVMGGYDKQGVLTPGCVRLLLHQGTPCFRCYGRRNGERRRKSVCGFIVSPDLFVLNLVIVKKGDADLPALTDIEKPWMRGSKRASNC